MSKGPRQFITVNAAPSLSNRHQATTSSVWLFCSLTDQRSMQNPCYSYAVLSHIKPGTCGPSPFSKEDTHPTSKPQQSRSGAASRMSAGKHIIDLVHSPRFSWCPYWTQADNGSDGILHWPYPCCLLQFIQTGWKMGRPSSCIFRERGGRRDSRQYQLAKNTNSNRVAHSSPSCRLNRHPNTFSACHVQSRLSSSLLCFACSLFRCNTNHTNMH